MVKFSRGYYAKLAKSGVIFTSQFIPSSNDNFQDYIDYMDRKEAVTNKDLKSYSGYNEYMDNPYKTTGIFTNDYSFISKEQKEDIKNIFDISQKNGSVLWQDVYSFDNRWLEEHGIYDNKKNILDEEKLKEAVRRSLSYSFKKMDMTESGFWCGNIHYNTKHIHIHIAICEPSPTRTRGKRTQKTLDTMKSKFANYLLDYSKEYSHINNLIRESIVKDSKNIDLKKDRVVKKHIKNIIDNLPSDSRHWHYNYNTMKDSKVHLNKLIDYYLEEYKPKEYKELLTELNKQKERLKRTYGVGKRAKYKDYKTNKIKELYTRIGNTILKEIKEDLKREKELEKRKVAFNNEVKSLKSSIKYTNIKVNKSFNEINKLMSNEIENLKNQSYYQQIQNEISYER